MRFVPDHVVQFELVDDVNFEIPSIKNPPIEFRVGTLLTLKRPFAEGEGIEEIKLEVTDVENTLYDYVDGELFIKVYLKRL